MKEQAGVKELADESNYYEIKEACALFNCSQPELFKMDDGFVTKMLYAEKKYINFESTYRDLKFNK